MDDNNNDGQMDDPLMMMEEPVKAGSGTPSKSYKPSDEWRSYTNSDFSERHLTPAERKKRTSTLILTAANITKMYLGVCFISQAQSFHQAGIYGALVSFTYAITINTFCIYLLLKARNRFKRERIVDIGDLAARLYGEGMRPFISILLILTNGSLLMAYVMFLGTQSDQLMCKTWKYRACGSAHFYSIAILIIISPAILLRELKNVGYFSLFILMFTIVAIVLIVYLTTDILLMTPDQAHDKYDIELTDEDRQYKYWDSTMVLVTCSTVMFLFEGSQQLLNVYAEADKPQNFFATSISIVVFLTVFVGIGLGLIGYLAFGATTKSIILYNLPNNDPLSVIAKVGYIFTVMGSFVIVSQPIFYCVERTDWYAAIGGPTAAEKKKKGDEANKKEGDKMLEDGDKKESEGMGSEKKSDKMEKSSKAGDDEEEEESWGCCNLTIYVLVRTIIVAIAVFCAFLFPNVNFLLTLSGAVLGTIMNVLIPVLFYLRAYSFSEKNRNLEKKTPGQENEEEAAALMGDMAEGEKEEPKDPRWCIKFFSYISFVLAVIVGTVGVVYSIMEVMDGSLKEDEV